MLNRRQVLLAAGALGAGPLFAAAKVPLAAATGQPGQRRLGLLQCVPAFIDAGDPAGSRQRAFAALCALLLRTALAHPSLDWLVIGPWALAGNTPLSPAIGRQLALREHSPELAWLAAFAHRQRLHLMLGARWGGERSSGKWRNAGVDRAASSHPPATGAGRQVMLLIAPDGRWQALTLAGAQQLSERAGLRLSGVSDTGGEAQALSAECRRLGLYGACLAPACLPALPPGVPDMDVRRTALYQPDGQVLASAVTGDEVCVVAQLS